ncbi:MAG: site-specific DNA-methyltransferase [Promethearchaeota archaeon]|nr:MAG: site-specific DNA-methyltransferase [Candidatus Lokiarchaeota archaeon]
MVNLTWNNKGTERNKANSVVDFHSFQIVSSNKESELLNKLFWGDNYDVLQFLMPDYKNKIDLIYVDPPFFSGSNYHVKIEGEGGDFESLLYQDQWNNDLDSYLQMLYKRMMLFEKLLSKKGLLFIHLDWHASHYVKVMLDEIFGENKFVNSIVWYYYNKYSAGKKALPRAHDDILVYSKSDNYELNEIRIPREKPIKQLKRVMVNGVLKNAKDKDGHVIYRIVKDKKMDDVWRIPCLQPASKEWTSFPTQKHHKLLERIIKMGSSEGDLIADFFCGSGTTLLAAEKLKRRWIGSDISNYAINLCNTRLKKLKHKGDLHQSYELYSDSSDEKVELINSGFFDKEIKLKR